MCRLFLNIVPSRSCSSFIHKFVIGKVHYVEQLNLLARAQILFWFIIWEHFSTRWFYFTLDMTNYLQL